MSRKNQTLDNNKNLTPELAAKLREIDWNLTALEIDSRNQKYYEDVAKPENVPISEAHSNWLIQQQKIKELQKLEVNHLESLSENLDNLIKLIGRNYYQ